jgi:hypothetical protein
VFLVTLPFSVALAGKIAGNAKPPDAEANLLTFLAMMR